MENEKAADNAAAKNLELYERFRKVPDSAKKPIQGGRLNGMTNISPMWRIKVLTEAFGPVGFGWKYVREKQWITTVPGSSELVANVNILFYYRMNGEWSEPIPATGGAMFARNERGGIYVSDEAYKMAETDALSVACKLLGIGADVYWEGDRDNKYEVYRNADPAPMPAPAPIPQRPRPQTPPMPFNQAPAAQAVRQ